VEGDADFRQVEWNHATEQACRRIVRLAVYEDLADEQDWTTIALTPATRRGAACIVAREAGVAAGLPALAAIVDEMQLDVTIDLLIRDGQEIVPGARLAALAGSVRDLLTGERTMLNLLGRLMGVATITRRFVEQTVGTKARIYDTRKTTPGWRLMEKYAVGCGGGRNHRLGLFDAVLIKDNHLAQLDRGSESERATLALQRTRAFLQQWTSHPKLVGRIVEIEVECLEQLQSALAELPDIVLLDNMNPSQLIEAVAARDAISPHVQLEASGGVTLESVREIAKSGVERISVGSLTHGARAIDVGLDWDG
jgi:nicotinate-nucleotide pyrophosphorylase (carboxylating)